MLDKINTLLELAKAAVVILPVVVALTEVVKRAFKIDETRYLPAVAVGFGVVASLFLIETSAMGAAVGVLLGLGASGLWDFGVKTIAGR